MNKVRSFWNNLSVATKLYIVVGVMAFMICVELFTLRFAMNQMSALRAFVAAEGMWSKGEKTSLLFLHKFVKTKDPKDFDSFMSWLEVPLGDHQARLELIKEVPDESAMYTGFLRGRIHRDDIPQIVFMVRHFYFVSYLKDALATWQEGDRLLGKYLQEGSRVRDLVHDQAPSSEIESALNAVEKTNDELTPLQDHFSYVLGEGSRWMEHVLLTVLLMLVITVEGTGLFLSFTFARTLKKSLLELIEASKRIGKGDLGTRLPIRSRDELGQLATSLNMMAQALEENIGVREQAERASSIKSAFLANMSHEIRTPLSAILGFTSVLRDPTLTDDERNEYIQIIDRNGKVLTNLIDDILDLSKVEAGSLNVEFLEFSLPKLLEEIVELMKGLASTKEIILKLKIHQSARKAVCSDPTRLRQIVVNLVGNAIKFTSKGGIVEVEAAVEQHISNEMIIIKVEDTGVGLTSDQKDRLFKPFSQADESTTRKFGGTGLGLVLSRKLAELLGGSVELASSEYGVGSVFEVKVKNVLEPISKVKAEKHLSNEQDQNFSNLRVLVAEDSPDTRELIKILCHRRGLSPDLVANGAEAVERAKSEPYDVIFLDIQMPEMDGFEALRIIRKTDSTTPIVAITAHALSDERKKALEAGFSKHLTKPIDEKLLFETIAEVTN